MRFAESHEWADLKGEVATIGVSAYAQKELGEIVFVDLPKIGSKIGAAHELCVVESTKAAVDIYSPLSGVVVEVNHSLQDAPEKVNQSPENEGWLVKIKISDPSEYDMLMSEKEYHDAIKEALL